MISKEFKKHSDIARPSYGKYSRNEWAIVGTHCSAIKSLADDIIAELSPVYKCAYADAKHAEETDENIPSSRLARGAIIDYTNHLNYHQFNYLHGFNQFEYRTVFNGADVVLVNGNHFEAKSQIVIIDQSKKESLKKRVSQLTNVELILLADNENEVFDFVREALPDTLPVYNLNETGRIIDFFKNKMQMAKPALNGLILAGGKSARLGFDKASIAWHGIEQQYYLAELLKDLCDEVYISCRPEQSGEKGNNYQTLTDTFTGLGPFGAILSAFREKPDAAWLVVACDLPLLKKETFNYLKEHRNTSCIATSFESPFNGFPEPLITIWEPKSYPVLLSFLSQGYTCPGKALRNSNTAILRIPDPEVLTNVNTQEEFEKVRQILARKSAPNHGS